MENKIYIVIIPVHYNNARKCCENIENMVFENKQQLSDILGNELEEKSFSWSIRSISDYIDLCNDGVFSHSKVYISYIKSTNDLTNL